MKQFKDVKIGDSVWSFRNGWETVTGFISAEIYPIITDRSSYTLEGKLFSHDTYLSAFLSSPFETESEYPKWMMVYDKCGNQYKRYVMAEYKGRYIAINNASSDLELDELDKYCYIATSCWANAKDIVEPEITELTLEQIAEKIGISVDQLKIKK